MSENGQGLPAGWTETTVVDLVGHEGLFCDGDWVESKDQDPSGGVRLIQLADVGDGEYRDRSNRFLTSAKAAELRCTYLMPGDLLIARMPDPLGRVCVFPGDAKTCVTVVDVCVVRLGSPVHSRWLMHQLNAPQMRQRVAALQSGSTRKRISRTNFSKILFPLPPLPEQDRIASVADELFSDLDAGVAALERVREKLKLYRASVLKAAVEGTLTADWRAQHPDTEPASELLKRIAAKRRRRWEEEQLRKFEEKGQEPPKNWKAKYKEPVPPDTTNQPELPQSWCWASFDQIGETQGGLQKSPSRKATKNHYPYLRVANVHRGSLDLHDLHRFELTKDELERLRLEPGDILIVEGNGSRTEIGRCAMWRGEVADCVHQNHIIRVRPLAGVIPRYVNVFLNSPHGQKAVQWVASSTSGLYTLSIRKIEKLPLALPPTDEQEAIVESVEDRLSIIEHVEADLDAKLKGAQALRQSILRHAFTGQLVPQGPNDEPASELLKRIAAECEARTHEAAAAKRTTKQTNGPRTGRRGRSKKKNQGKG